MPSWGDLFPEGSIAEQFLIWNVGSAVVSAVLGPVLTTVQSEIWSGAVGSSGGHVHAPLSPADYANAVVRNFLGDQAAAHGAAMSGVNAGDFDTLVHLAGDAPAPGQLAEALRRKIIPEGGTGPSSVSFEQGIAEGRLSDKWAPVIQQLSQIWPTPTDALQAYLEGQVDEGTAQELYQRFGGDPEYFQLLYNTRGNAPTPMEALTMLRRGIIPESGTGPDSISYQQAFLEGPWRNKWLGPFKALAEYLPPPRTVSALLKSGAIDQATAQKIWQQSGLSPQMAAAYAKSASGEKLAGSKQLAQGLILTLYETQAITAAEASSDLTALGYGATEVKLVLEITDLQRELRVLNSSITRIGSLYVARKITRKAAAEALTALDVLGDHQAHILSLWDIERTANVKQLTAAEITAAYEYQNMTESEALTELQNLGYTPFDAWVLLSNKAKGPLGERPPMVDTGPGVIP